MQNNNIKLIYKNLTQDLCAIYTQSEAQSLARIVIEKVTGKTLHQILTFDNQVLSKQGVDQITSYLLQLKLQKPIQYILGETEFFGINFKVSPSVLIPRPETEELVDWIIKSNAKSNPVILDIGTGSGCISVALAKNIPKARVFAMDISANAIAVAKDNAISAGVNIGFIEQDVLALPNYIEGAPFDIIASNPPYVRESEKLFMQPNVLENEPQLALFVNDNDPLVFYKAIASLAQNHLEDNGIIFCEINEALGSETAEIFSSAGFTNIEIKEDINGKLRMLKVSKR